MEDIVKIDKSVEEFGLFIKGVSATIDNETKTEKGWFLNMFLGTLGAWLSGKVLAGKDTIRAGEGTTRVRQDFYYHFIL